MASDGEPTDADRYEVLRLAFGRDDESIEERQDRLKSLGDLLTMAGVNWKWAWPYPESPDPWIVLRIEEDKKNLVIALAHARDARVMENKIFYHPGWVALEFN